MKTFKLQIVTPERSEILQNIYSITAESVMGKFTALSDHEPFMMQLKPCIIHTVNSQNIVKEFFVNNATIKIMPGLYSIIAEELYNIETIDKNFLASYYDPKIALKIAQTLNLE